MRLIDGTIQPLPITNYILERKDEIIDLLQKEDGNALFSLMMEYFDNQPTAYDVERVVEQLQELPRESSWNHNSENINRGKAIDIVREGGAE